MEPQNLDHSSPSTFIKKIWKTTIIANLSDKQVIFLIVFFILFFIVGELFLPKTKEITSPALSEDGVITSIEKELLESKNAAENVPNKTSEGLKVTGVLPDEASLTATGTSEISSEINSIDLGDLDFDIKNLDADINQL